MAKTTRIPVIEATSFEDGLREMVKRRLLLAGRGHCAETRRRLEPAIRVAIEIGHFFLDARDAGAPPREVLPTPETLVFLTGETNPEIIAAAWRIWDAFVDEVIDGPGGPRA